MSIQHLIKSSLSGSGAPTSITAQFIGQIYVDTSSSSMYIAASVTEGDFTELGTGSEISAHISDTDNPHSVLASQLAYTHPELTGVATVEEALTEIVNYLLEGYFVTTSLSIIDGNSTITGGTHHEIALYDVMHDMNFKVKVSTVSFDGIADAKVPEDFTVYMNGVALKPGKISSGSELEFIETGTTGYAEAIHIHKDFVEDLDSSDPTDIIEIVGKGKGFSL